MGILIKNKAEPLSEASLGADDEEAVVPAPSAARTILLEELRRYCAGQIHGRSFLIAGHRGAGKTTMVNAAIDTILREGRLTKPTAGMRPLAVFLHGPSLFELDGDADVAARPAVGRLPAIDDSDGESLMEYQAKVVLVHVILGLHRAVVREYVAAYRARMLARYREQRESSQVTDFLELAAQFEMEILEDPSAARLKEFWDLAELGETGVLFSSTRQVDQGYRELVALNGMCNAHQRISGDISSRDVRGQHESTDKTTTHDSKPPSREKSGVAELVKPLTAVLAGTVVTTGGVASNNAVMGALAGLLTALVASSFFTSVTTATEKRSRQVDITFMPDLSHKTLDRVLPTLLQRLQAAGLAPVFIIDELDKVRGLPDKLRGMIQFLKKLVAENVFTCFLTDRAYMEHLRLSGEETSYGRTYSYFSQPLLITFTPADLKQYLGKLLKAEADPQWPKAEGQGSPSTIDLEVLKWVLRHRSRLHGLALAREVAALRTAEGKVSIPEANIRSDYPSLIDVTFQVAVEAQLRRQDVIGWQKQRPNMLQALNDSLYFLSREWAAGADKTLLGAEGCECLKQKLSERMNLKELQMAFDGQAQADVVCDDDLRLLFSVVEGMVQFLVNATDKDAVNRQWNETSAALKLPVEAERLEQSVLDALRLGKDSLLYAVPPGGTKLFRWRYFPSGAIRPDPDNLQQPVTIDSAIEAASFIRRAEAQLGKALGRVAGYAADSTPVFELLADRLRLLPTSPGWSAVAHAMLSIDGTKQGQAPLERASLEDNCRTVVEFGQVLKDNEAVACHALLHAAALGGLTVESRKPAAAMKRGLEILSGGLRFHAASTTQIGEMLAALELQLRELPVAEPLLALAAAAPEQWRFDHPQFLARLSDARAQGERMARELPWLETTEAAWNSIVERAAVLRESGSIEPAALPELLCATRHRGPSALIPFDLQAASLRNWSHFLFARIPAQSGAQEPPPPPRLLAFALRQLGAATLHPHLLAQLKRVCGISRESEANLTGRYDFLSGGGDSMRLGVLLTADLGSAAEAWVAPAPAGCLLVVPEGDWNELAVRWEQAPPSANILVAVEDAIASKASLLLTQMRKDIGTMRVHVYAQKAPVMLEPHVVAPAGPADVLAAFASPADPPGPQSL